MAACREGTDPAENPALKHEIRAARRAMIPESYIQRVIQFARQGYTAIDFRTYDTDWDSEAYLTVAGQNSNNSVRVSNDFLERVAADGPWNLVRRTDGKIAKTLPARELWDRIGHAAWASADPGLQFDTTINEWHTCVGERPDQRLQPVLGIQFSRRHGVQPRLAEPDGVPRGAAAAKAVLTSPPSSTPCGCGPSCSRSRC